MSVSAVTRPFEDRLTDDTAVHLTVTPRSLMPLAYFWSYSPFASQVNNLFRD
ncbi:hypothetical protein ECDEC14D_5326 [Escherichia coli DEC14D]|nr:hypothetical protein ECDEC14D_5326 [Escherichia coli DEC14D]